MSNLSTAHSPDEWIVRFNPRLYGVDMYGADACVWRRMREMEGALRGEVMGLRRVGDVLEKRSEQRICFCALSVEVGGDTVNQKGIGQDIG